MKSLSLAAMALFLVSCLDTYNNSICGPGIKLDGLAGTYQASFMGSEMKVLVEDLNSSYSITMLDEGETERSNFKACEVGSETYFEFYEDGKKGFGAARSELDLSRGMIKIEHLNFDRKVLDQYGLSYEVVSSDWSSNLVVENEQRFNQIMLESAMPEMTMYLIKE